VAGGTILGNRYRFVDRLGKGGMGEVWRAYDEVLDRHVAIKVLAAQFARDAEFRSRVLSEARAAARLTHPHIARVYDYGESGQGRKRVPYVVMELLTGPSLDERLKRGPLRVERALRICAEVASALAAAHASGLVHRDVKPGNVMLTRSGAKVVDFGLAAVTGERDHPDGAGMLGTPAYLAPERLSGHPVVPATDVYALGLLLYRLLVGKLPWPASTATQMLKAHVYLDPAPMPQLPGVPPVVIDLVHRCLFKEPTERPPSSEVTVTLAHAIGIRVPLEGIADDDLEETTTERLRRLTRPVRRPTPEPASRAPTPPAGVDPVASLPSWAFIGDEPYAARLVKYLDVSLNHVDLRRQASALLHGAVGFDLAIWAVLDPMTHLWTSCVIDGGPYDDEFEQELFANEYGQDDVLKLVELAGDGRSGVLWTATGGDPVSSRRFRTILQPRGFADELRQPLYDSSGAWGALLLFRAVGRFTDDDLAQLAPAARTVGSALHHALVRPPPAPVNRSGRGRDAPSEPAGSFGTLTVSDEGRLLDVTAGARALLDAEQLDRIATAVSQGRRFGLLDASGVLNSASRDGLLLVYCAARRRSALAVTVQRIHPDQVSEFVARAYALEPWKWRLLGALARGHNTRQIAQQLSMSVYEVQDGMSELFKTFGVHGRIELVKSLFFDHCGPLHAADTVAAQRS
jgi:hypothetical protein